MVGAPDVLLIILFGISYGDTSHRYQPGKQPILLIGIFSNCNVKNNSITQEDAFQHESHVCRSSIDWVIEHKNFVNNKTQAYHKEKNTGYFQYWRGEPNYLDNIRYIAFEICTQGEAVGLALELVLGRKYHVQDIYQRYPTWRGREIDDWERATRVMAVMLYTTDSITRSILPVFDQSTFMVYHLNPSAVIPWYYFWTYQHRPKNYLKRVLKIKSTKVFDKIDEVLDRTNVFAFTVVLFGPRYDLYQDVFKWINKSNTYCYAVERINAQNKHTVNEFLAKILLERDIADFIILFGEGDDQVSLFNAAIKRGVTNRTWFMQNIEISHSGILSIPMASKVYAFYNEKNKDLYYLEQFQSLEVIEDYVRRHANNEIFEYSSSISKVRRVVTICSRFTKRLLAAYMITLNPLTIIRYYPDYQHFLKLVQIYVNQIDFNKLRFLFIQGKFIRGFPYRSYLEQNMQNIMCARPTCNKGWFNRRGEITLQKHKKQLNYTIGWTCEKCPENTYKMYNGDGECLPCPGLLVPNRHHSSCYNPYRTLYNNMEWLSVKLCIFLSSLGLFISVFILIIFSCYRKTCLVRSLDFKTVSLHLVLLCTSFVSYPLLFFTNVSLQICIVRPFVVSILQCSCMAIMFIKSNRVLVIFTAKLRLSQGEMNKMTAFYILSVLTFNVIGVSIALICMASSPAQIQEELNLDEFTKDIWCTNASHVKAQICYLLLLQILPSIQAFRGRHLPGLFNEAMAIFCITFATIATYTVTLLILFFQSLESMKTTIQCYALLVANTIQLVVLYGKRTYFILFKCNKNNKDYVRSGIRNSFLDQ